MNWILRFSLMIAVGCPNFIFNGCSINNYGIDGILDQEVNVTASAKIVSTKAKGIYLYTKPVIGIQIGYIERDLIFPVLTYEPLYCASKLLKNGPLVPGDTQTDFIEKPVLIETERVGVGMELSLYLFTGNLGINRTRMVRIEADSSFSMYYLSSDENEETDICVTVND